MDFTTAAEIVNNYKESQGLPGLLEALEEMRDNIDDLTGQEQVAFRVVFNGMAKLFAPA